MTHPSDITPLLTNRNDSRGDFGGINSSNYADVTTESGRHDSLATQRERAHFTSSSDVVSSSTSSVSSQGHQNDDAVSHQQTETHQSRGRRSRTSSTSRSNNRDIKSSHQQSPFTGPIFLDDASSTKTFSFISKMEQYFRRRVLFHGVLTNLSQADCRGESSVPVKVELIHVAEWGQFFLLQDNPRILLKIVVMQPDGSQQTAPRITRKHDLLRLNLFMKHKSSDKKNNSHHGGKLSHNKGHCFFSRTFRFSEHANKIYEYNTEEGARRREKSFGMNRDFITVLEKQGQQQEWNLILMRCHFSLFSIYEGLLL